MFLSESNAARFWGLRQFSGAARFFGLRKFLAAALAFLCAPAFSQNVSLLEQSSQKGQTLYWDTLAQSGVLEKNGKQVSFRADSNVILLDNEKFALTDAPKIEAGYHLQKILM